LLEQRLNSYSLTAVIGCGKSLRTARAEVAPIERRVQGAPPLWALLHVSRTGHLPPSRHRLRR
jgi:hypothetical protein